MAQFAKAIAGTVGASVVAGVAAITEQCGHPLNWLAVGGAIVATAFAVWRIPNAAAATPGPSQPGVGG